MIFKNKTCFEDEQAYCGELFSLKIILMGTVLKDSKTIIQHLMLRINGKEKLDTVINKDEEIGETKDREAMSQSSITEDRKKCC